MNQTQECKETDLDYSKDAPTEKKNAPECRKSRPKTAQNAPRVPRAPQDVKEHPKSVALGRLRGREGRR